MKHLKRIFESLNIDELRDTIDAYFAYLYDEGFSVNCLTTKGVSPAVKFITVKSKDGKV